MNVGLQYRNECFASIFVIGSVIKYTSTMQNITLATNSEIRSIVAPKHFSFPFIGEKLMVQQARFKIYVWTTYKIISHIYQFPIANNKQNKQITIMNESSLDYTLLTPHDKITGSKRSSSTRRHSAHKRTPIFANFPNNKPRNIYTAVKLNKGLELDHIFSERKVITYDFCGCENKMTTCDIIEGNFLANVSRNELRACYSEEYDKAVKTIDMKDSRYNISLLSYLPSWYPELLYSQLKNLVQVIGKDKIDPVSFQCLAAIEYHCKAEYITYFLFKDLKKSYQNKQQFCSLVERELSLLNTSFKKLKYQYEETTYLAAQLEKFINNYYDSVGANLVPIQYYAKFLAAIYVKGSKVFVRMLTNFLALRQNQLKRGLKFLLIHELEAYRNYMREFNFQDFIQQAQ